MSLEVALAMQQRDGRWLMQLREEIPGIVAPELFGTLGGHLDSGETPEQALRRELLEGQDMALVSTEDVLVGASWSSRLGSHCPLADGLLVVMQHVLTQQTCDTTKPGVLTPGICLLSRGAFPRGRAQLCEFGAGHQPSHFQIRGFSVVLGAACAGTLGHAFQVWDGWSSCGHLWRCGWSVDQSGAQG